MKDGRRRDSPEALLLKRRNVERSRGQWSSQGIPPWKRGGITTCLPLTLCVLLSNTLSLDGEFNGRELVLTLLVTFLTFFVCLALSCKIPFADTSFVFRAKRLAVCVPLFCLSLPIIILTGAIDGGAGWVVGLVESTVVGFVAAFAIRFCC